MRFMTFAFGGLALALLGACSPLQQCLSAADRDIREISRELDERRANLARGYSVERGYQQELVSSICPGPQGQPVPCMRWENVPTATTHRINRAYEAERVALLEQQLARAEAEAESARAQCAATYPE